MVAYDFRTILTALGIDLAVFLVALTLFNILRVSNFSKRLYSPRRYSSSKNERPKRLPKGFFLGWVRTLFSYTKQDIVDLAGYDGAVYLKVFSFGLKLFTIIGVWNFMTVLPTNLSGHRVNDLIRFQNGDLSRKAAKDLLRTDKGIRIQSNVTITDFEEGESSKYEFADFDRLSMSNIGQGSSKLWVHLISIYFVTFATLKLLLSYHLEAVDQRIEYLGTTKKGQESHTVLVTDIPGVRFGSPLDRLIRLPVFKLLPNRTKARVEDTVERMFSVSARKVGSFGVKLARGVAKGAVDAVSLNTGGLKEKLRFWKGSDSARSSRSTEIKGVDGFVDASEKFQRQSPTQQRPKASDVTDMAPFEWAKERLENGLDIEKLVEVQFREVYSDLQVECARVVRNTTDLEPVVEEYEKTKRQLEDIVDAYKSKVRRKIKVVRRKIDIIPLAVGKWAEEFYGKVPCRVDTMLFLTRKLENLRSKIEKLQTEADLDVVPSAFVTFRTRWAQVVAATSLHHHFESFWRAEAAPHPEEIVWENLKWRGWERTIRKIVVWAAFTLLCMFFMIPITFIQAIIEVDRLEKAPVIGTIIELPVVNGWLKGILPNIVLQIFLMVLPSIIDFMNRKQGLYSLSSIDAETARKYFIFQVITIFFFSFLTRTLLGQTKELWRQPSSIITILGTAAPQAASFFINFILFKGLFEGAIAFLKVTRLVMFYILTRCAGTERAKARLWQDQTVQYGQELPQHMLVILLGLVFCTVNPMILPAVLLYFMAMTLYWRYDLLYVYTGEYESGGRMWMQVFNQVITGLLIFQLTMSGLLTFKEFPYAPLLIPLPFITIGFKLFMDSLFKRPLTVLSLRAAHDLDVRDEELEQESQYTEEEEEPPSTFDNYVNPVMKIDWQELVSLLDEAQAMDGTLEKQGRGFSELKEDIFVSMQDISLDVDEIDAA